MGRVAYIGGSTLGALEAYDRIITDLSNALEVEDTAVRTLFFGGMILSGIDHVLVPQNVIQSLPQEIAAYVKPRDDSTPREIYGEIEDLVWAHALIEKRSKKAVYLNELVAFMCELIPATDQGCPLLTTFPTPNLRSVSGLLRREFHDVVTHLENAISQVETSSPLLAAKVPKVHVGRVKEILRSELFKSYACALDQAHAEGFAGSSIQAWKGKATSLTQGFPDVLKVRSVGAKIFGLVPDVVEQIFGKLSGKASRVITDPLARVIEGRSSTEIFSFYPVWKEIWECRLDVVSRLGQAKARS